jgi:flavorubredoxin
MLAAAGLHYCCAACVFILRGGGNMTISNATSGTNIHEIANGIFRINTATDTVPGGFSFNQYLIVDGRPLLFDTGPRKMFPLVFEAVESIIPASRLRFISLSHRGR